MKKILLILSLLVIGHLLLATDCYAAIAIKKAEPVATNESGGTSGATSLVPTLLGLVANVQEVNARQNALTQECIPSSTEMNFVDETMKEWAKTGQMTHEQVRVLLHREPCGVPSSDVRGYTDCYASDASGGNTPGMVPRYNIFSGPGNYNMVWAGFPRAGKGEYCKDGGTLCNARDRTVVTDTYDLFNIIDFGPEDYLPTEATRAANLLAKVEKCSGAKLSAKKKELWGAFLVDTVGNLGQPTNTGTIMDTVGTMIQSGPSGGVAGIAGIAQQFLNK